MEAYHDGRRSQVITVNYAKLYTAQRSESGWSVWSVPVSNGQFGDIKVEVVRVKKKKKLCMRRSYIVQHSRTKSVPRLSGPPASREESVENIQTLGHAQRKGRFVLGVRGGYVAYTTEM